jgi:hypothetical protein
MWAACHTRLGVVLPAGYSSHTFASRAKQRDTPRAAAAAAAAAAAQLAVTAMSARGCSNLIMMMQKFGR